ncbi:MAG: hypothetical protein JO253_06210 [Alphaproteobacteria bacterium]|nr:hypothetical protein [Alphaproteobacteria bacterium]
MTGANSPITYAELTTLYGPKAAHDFLLAVERHAAAGHNRSSNVIYLNASVRWQCAMAQLVDASDVRAALDNAA